MLPLRSHLDAAVARGEFHWAAGIEDSFIADPWHRTGRSLDEYELTDHYQYWREDLELIHALGLRAARYGLPWHRIAPTATQRDWDWCDRVMERLRQLEIDPILDLVHYGVPGWLERAYLHPDFPQRMAEHAAEVADRYPWVRWFTPLNEPRIAAWYCGRIGWWPPYSSSWQGFAAILVAAARGMVLSARALRQLSTDNVIAHVDAGDLYVTDEVDLMAVADYRQQLVFLALDLICGRVDDAHPMHRWLIGHGIDAEAIHWFRENADIPDVIGVNLYPMFTLKRLELAGKRIRVRMPYADGDLVERMVEPYWQRYQRPVMITETASRGSVERRRKWLGDSVAAVARARQRGVPLIGYTWWPLFGLIAWSYRQGQRDLDLYIQQMGLWDLIRDSQNRLVRVPTDVANDFRAVIARGTAAVGNSLMS